MQDVQLSPHSLLPGSKAAGTSSAKEELEAAASATAYVNIYSLSAG